jgi:16S rRNA C967 or C1407 C5-methylase (RsmB/RsmF family)
MIYNSESYLRNYDRFVTRTENNYTEYNEAEWENTEARYEEFNTTFYKRVYQDLTPKDQQAIGKLKARYNAIKMKYKFNLLKRDVKDGIEQLKGVLEKDSVD